MSEPIKTRLNALLIGIAVLANLYQFLFLPLLLSLPAAPMWLATLLPCIVLSNPLWYLMHESFHGNLHFNYHRVHHHDPRLPWTALPGAFRRSDETFDASLLAAAIVQFRGPRPMPSTR
jgi:sterol desaturase/sphingolipid hydroxylase (fatty acid hydroxylase superfamily)